MTFRRFKKYMSKKEIEAAKTLGELEGKDAEQMYDECRKHALKKEGDSGVAQTMKDLMKAKKGQ